MAWFRGIQNFLKVDDSFNLSSVFHLLVFIRWLAVDINVVLRGISVSTSEKKSLYVRLRCEGNVSSLSFINLITRLHCIVFKSLRECLYLHLLVLVARCQNYGFTLNKGR